MDDETYVELLLGKKPKNKDPRWHRVKGLGMALNIMVGKCEKGFLYRHIATYLKYQKELIKADINHVWFCKNCGTKWDKWMKYCPIHGTKLEWFDHP